MNLEWTIKAVLWGQSVSCVVEKLDNSFELSTFYATKSKLITNGVEMSINKLTSLPVGPLANLQFYECNFPKWEQN